MTGMADEQHIAGHARQKILVVTPRYMISGVALAQTRFARALAEAGHDVTLMIGRIDPHLQPPAIPGIDIRILGKHRTAGMFMPLCTYLRRERPDVVFSAEDHLNALVLAAAAITGSKAKISGSCRVTPFDTYRGPPLSKRWILKQVMRTLSWRADALTCVSKDMVGQYRRVFRNPPHTHVYNIVDDRESRERMAEAVDEPWLIEKTVPMVLAAGSLQPWKDFGTLVEAMALVAKDGRDARLIILGEGPLHADLQAQIEQFGLTDRIKLAGFTYNPLKYFVKADVFALSSTVEGMPNVLVEAMMCGATPVSTDCETGPRELLQDGRYGILVPVGDARAMADAIVQAIDHPIPAATLAEAVRPFTADRVIARHFEMLGVDRS